MVNTILGYDEIGQVRDSFGPGPIGLYELSRAIEAEVLAKLREQEPVAWLLYFTNEHGESMREIFFYKASVERHKTHNETVRGLKCRVEPLYTTPLPAVAQVPLNDALWGLFNEHNTPIKTRDAVIAMLAAAPEAPAQADRREVTQQEDAVLRRAAMRSAKVIHEPAQPIPAAWVEAVKVAREALAGLGEYSLTYQSSVRVQNALTQLDALTKGRP